MNKKINPAVAIAIILFTASAFAFFLLKTNRVEAPAETKNQKETPKNMEKNNEIDKNQAANTNTDENPADMQIGYPKAIYQKNEKYYISIDYIQFLTGAEAEKAMREDRKCPKTGECEVYDGYYIRNQNKAIRTFEISSDAAIEESAVFKGEGDGNDYIKVSYEDFAKGFSQNDNHLKDLPVWIEINNNVVTKIIQQYLP
jgi:hypothetical protein